MPAQITVRVEESEPQSPHLQDLTVSNPVAVFGEIDAMKLRSSLTLFGAVRQSALLAAALDRWFGGERDPVTLRLLGND